ncbi:MAG: dihydrofolate reductase [Patescibacteria group bacterium]|nr:dihydrofolate reductase [Patescibacteria group bacterium]
MLAIIAAVGNYGVYSIGNKLPWEHHGVILREDMRRFKQMTTGNIVIMGRGTFESLGKKPLPHRINIVVSRRARTKDGVLIESNFASALSLAKYLAEGRTIFAIGGISVWREAFPIADELYITEVNKEYARPDADGVRSFPVFLDPERHSRFKETSREGFFDKKADTYYDFVKYVRT